MRWCDFIMCNYDGFRMWLQWIPWILSWKLFLIDWRGIDVKVNWNNYIFPISSISIFVVPYLRFSLVNNIKYLILDRLWALLPCHIIINFCMRKRTTAWNPDSWSIIKIMFSWLSRCTQRWFINCPGFIFVFMLAVNGATIRNYRFSSGSVCQF